MPVLEKNCTMQGWEGYPCQDGMRVLPTQKGQGGQMRVVAHPHPSALPPVVEGFLFVEAAPPPPPLSPPPPPPLQLALKTRYLRAIGRIGLTYQPDVSAPFQLIQDWIQ